MVRFHHCWSAQLLGMLLLPVIAVELQAQTTPTDPPATAGNSALAAETPAAKMTIYLSETNSEAVRKTNDFACYVASRTEVSVADWTPTFDRNKPLITLVCYSEPDPKRITGLVNGIRNLGVPDVGLLFRLDADSKPSDQLIIETPALLDQAELKPLWDYLKAQPDFEILAPAGNVIQAATKVTVFSFSVGIAGQTSSELRQQYDTLEERAKVLSRKLRQPLPDPATGDKLKSERRSTVQQAFETRQKLQRAELAEFAQRLQGIQQSIEMRDLISQQIIDRRVEELLDPNLKWEEADANSGRAQALRSSAADDLPNETPDGSRRSANQPSVPTQGVLGKSPQEFNDLLAQETGACNAVEANLGRWEEARSKGKGGEQADAMIQSLQQELGKHKRRLTFAVQEYLEQIKLLEAVLQRDRARLAQADKAMQQIEALRKESLSTVTELRERELQQQEARVALQRSESLLKLYRQAGEGFVPSSDESATTPSSASDRVIAAPSVDLKDTSETDKSYSRENRWEVRYPNDPKQFGRALDYFGVELGSADGDTKEITYLSSLSAGELGVRRDLSARESRLFLTEADGESIHLAKTYLDQAGIETRVRLVMWFYSDETAQLLADLEAKHAAGKPVELVEKTVFGARSKGDGFEFYVISQSVNPPKSRSDAEPTDGAAQKVATTLKALSGEWVLIGYHWPQENKEQYPEFEEIYSLSDQGFTIRRNGEKTASGSVELNLDAESPRLTLKFRDENGFTGAHIDGPFEIRPDGELWLAVHDTSVRPSAEAVLAEQPRYIWKLKRVVEVSRAADAEVEAASERGAAASSSINSKLAEICSQEAASQKPAVPVEVVIAKELERFQATWAVDLCDSETKDFGETQEWVKSWRWAIHGNEIKWTRSNGEIWKLTFAIDPDKSPSEIDLTFLDGPHKGETCLGMYQWGGVNKSMLLMSVQDPDAKVARQPHPHLLKVLLIEQRQRNFDAQTGRRYHELYVTRRAM